MTAAVAFVHDGGPSKGPPNPSGHDGGPSKGPPNPSGHDGAPSNAPELEASAPPRSRSLLSYLGRHQIASIISTAVDFGTMVLAVELLRFSPVAGTIAGASCGAVTNFQLGRHFTFAAHHDHVGHQALRYALVSGASAGLNALGEYALHDVLGVQYFGARAVVAVAVSLFWNFPLQRYFVFRAARQAALSSAPESFASPPAPQDPS